MIKVQLAEEPRIFHLSIGRKVIGQVIACWPGYCRAQIRSDDGVFCDIDHRKTVRKAAQLILERAGYGPADGIQVVRRLSQ